ncbi:hypothetical protein B0H10DRAFT_1945636 [Mycena sp. CBHHK59/15]|nr:hypothetical protein B0H10DRAFT_1945636 [Mycena sp. CBHHK59/15]
MSSFPKGVQVGEEGSGRVQAAVEKVLGTDFLQKPADVLREFSEAKALRMLNLLKDYKKHLYWSPLSDEDVKAMTIELPATLDGLRTHYDRLTHAAHRHKYSSAGSPVSWSPRARALTGATPWKTPRWIPPCSAHIAAALPLQMSSPSSSTPLTQRSLPLKFRPGTTSSPYSLRHGQTATPKRMTVPLRLPSSTAPPRGQGRPGPRVAKTSALSGCRATELAKYLGLSADHLPLPSWRNLTPNAKDYLPNQGNPILGITTKTELKYAQLSAMSIIIKDMKGPVCGPDIDMLGGSLNPDKAPVALQEGWNQVPGVMLTDEVGLGKMGTCLSTCTTLMQLQPLQLRHQHGEKILLPPCLSNKFGHLNVIPDVPHLIIVPPAVAAQWESEANCFLQEGSFTFIVWPQDVLKIRWAASPIRTIVIIQQNTLTRHFALAWAGINRNGTPLLSYPLPEDNRFHYSYASIWVDEVHEACRPTKLFHSINGIFQLSLLKVLATATPLVEGPADLYHMVHLLCPAMLTGSVAAWIMVQLTSLDHLKNKVRIEAEMQGLTFQGFKKVDETSGTKNPEETLASTIVLTIQRHLATTTICCTSSSRNCNGIEISKSLLALTVLHAFIPLRANKIKLAHGLLPTEASMERALDKGNKWLHGAVYHISRNTISNPIRKDTPHPMSIDKLQDHVMSMIMGLIELVVWIVTCGPDSVVPEKLHGSCKHIIGLVADLGVPDPTTHTAQHPEKVIIYTMLVIHHKTIIVLFEDFGLKAVSISHLYMLKKRNENLAQFRDDPTIQLLIMTSVGAIGLNLTCTCTLILFDIDWSEVLSHQAGQLRTTFAIHLITHDTIETVLVWNSIQCVNVARDIDEL